jgi:bacillithiol biosynthesis deacetylase BshB1
MTTCDALAISPHPDDAEIGVGGTLALLSTRGYGVGIVDLTKGELGSRGTPEMRAAEAAEASKILGLRTRINLGLPDGHLSARDDSQMISIVECLRRLKPKLVFIAAPDGRHPDHDEGYQLVKRALFFSGLRKFSTPHAIDPLSAPTILEYPTRREISASLVVDVSSVYERKLDSIRAYRSQLGLDNSSGPKTLMSSPLTLEAIKARDVLAGAMVGTAQGEALRSASPLKVEDPMAFFSSASVSGAVFFPEAP